LLYFAFSLSFFQREGCPWDRVSLYWQSLKDEKENLSYTHKPVKPYLRKNKLFIYEIEIIRCIALRSFY
jgi:hypothetical protein